MLGSISNSILHLHGWVALAIVFLIPTLEASAFLGFLFPGEIAVLLGGVLAYEGRISLPSAIAAAVLGAVLGDSIGYVVGRRWGRGLLHGTLGRVPIIKRHLDRHLDAAQAYVRRRKGSAVFFGRFTAALRVLVPGLAGMSEVHYPTFLAYNLAGGVLWGAGFVLLGYLGGASYHRVARIASRAGLVLLALVVFALLAERLLHRLQERDPGLRRTVVRIGRFPPFGWVRRRFPNQVAWLGRRLDPSNPRGFPLSLALAVAALAGWAFGGLTQDVVGRDEMALVDPKVTSWVVGHRMSALTVVLNVLTWLGSIGVIVPLGLALGGWFLLRRRDWRPLAMLAVTVGGAVATFHIVKPIVGRPRPPASLWIGHYTGAAFPSGHATQAVSFYAMAAILVATRASIRRRALTWALAAAVVLIVGFSRLYLGAHWLTDVLGGYAIAVTWVALVAAVRLGTSGAQRDPSVGSDTGRFLAFPTKPWRCRGVLTFPSSRSRGRPPSTPSG
jgi:membrane protein DedA with SNARE-associated domain/membrane-associated phospholipid phosphatase